MNYIEEMMKTAGVNLMPLDCNRCGAQRFALGECAETDCSRKYPDFTAEKQIEIIKLIANTNNIQLGKVEINNGYCFLILKRNCFIEAENENFTQALAELTTNLMYKGELDKEKVKEILE